MALASPRPCGFGNGLIGLNVGQARVARGAGEGRGWRMTVPRSAAADRTFVGIREGVEDLPLPEGDLGLPIIGNTIERFSNPSKFYSERLKRYGPIYKTHILGNKSVHVYGVDLIQQVIQQDKELMEKTVGGSLAKLVGEHSLSRTNGAEHVYLRQLLNPLFGKATINGYIPSIVERTEQDCEEWANKGYTSLVKQVKRHTLEVFALSVARFNLNEIPMDEFSDLVDTVCDGLLSFGINLPFTKFGKAMKAREAILKVIDGEIDSLGSSPYHGGESMLKRLLEAEDDCGRKLSRAQIKDIIINITIAGYGTTTCVIIFIMMELTKNSKIWEKLRDEQNEVISSLGSEITSKTMQAMPYLDAVVQEGLRIVPAVSVIRKALKTFEVNGYKIPKGWNVMIQTGTTTRDLDPRWQNYDEFCPERYLMDNGRKQGPFAPFGLGIRGCIGKVIAVVEAKILFAVLARSYKVFIGNPTPEMKYIPIIEPKDGLPGRIVRI